MDSFEDSSYFKVLSIQSHVVSGYVGNKSACFPLQVLGFEVDSINSVHISNHTGYKYIKGQRLDAEDLKEVFDGLKLNNLTNYTHVLTGYVGTETFLQKLIDIIKELKILNPSLYYVCDPVMGDDNKMYVPEALLPIFRDYVLPLADLITPNQFETEILTGKSIKSKEDVMEAIEVFHSKGVETVVISSVELQSSSKLQLFGSSNKGGRRNLVHMEIPKVICPAKVSFTGTGDLFTALLLAWMAKTEGDLKVSCEKAVNTMISVLNRTVKYALATDDPGLSQSIELKLIQSKNDIENPPEVLKCSEL